MLPNWREVNHLLVACSFEQAMAAKQLEPTRQILHQSLPQAHLTLLTTEVTGYTIRPNFFIEEVYSSYTSTQLINHLQQQDFDATIIFTLPSQSPYTLAYLFYLSRIPVRLGQSLEFGGSLLSEWIKLPIDFVSLADYHLHLLKSVGLYTENSSSISL